jgi:fructosamine-3-kinase
VKINEYMDRRKETFYIKTDDLPVREWHKICPKIAQTPFGPTSEVLRVSTVKNDYGMLVEPKVVAEVSKFGVPTVNTRASYNNGIFTHHMSRAHGMELTEAPDETKYMAYKNLGALMALWHTISVGTGYGLINPFESGFTGHAPFWSSYLHNHFLEHLEYAQAHNLISSAQHHYIDIILKRFCGKLHFFYPALLHGDLSDRNVFVDSTGGVTAILDWEDALIGDPIFDIAYWATFINHPENTHPYFIDTYYKHYEKPHDFAYRFWVYYLRISLSKLVQLHRYKVPNLTKAINRIELALTKDILP